MVIGYSFGINSGLRYDQVWLDSFVEALSVNTAAAIHIVAPDANQLRGELVERLKRTVNVHAWPFRWNTVATALEDAARQARVPTMDALRLDRQAMETLNRAMGTESAMA